MKKTLALILAAALMLCMIIPAFATSESKITITNPYENIDFSSVNAYKTALHTHTNASDGSQTLKESVKLHLDAGFDIVATSDHGNVNYSWEDGNADNIVHFFLSVAGRSEGELVYLGKSGTFEDGTAYTYGEDSNGDGFVSLENGKKMLRLPYAIENNAVSINAHVNSWFADYCDDTVTIYEDAVKGVEKAGGVSVINHPGEYTKARYELHTENAYNEKNPSYAYYINKYAHLLENYDSCIGIDMNSKGDKRTRFDRKLWDILLTRFANNGENVYGIASSDAHQTDVVDTGYTLLLMPELSSAAARTALENGEFFAASHCIGNPDEVKEIANALKEFYGETELYNKVKAVSDAIEAKIYGIEHGDIDADKDIDIVYTVLDENGICTAKTHPEIKNIAVDDDKDTIELDTENALIVRFISNGKLICTQNVENGKVVFDLNDYTDKLGNYVRAEVFGEGGMLYTQAFILNAEENAGTSKVVKGIYFNIGFIDFMLAEFNNWFEIIARFITKIF